MSEFVDFLLDTLAVIGPVRARRMFGGHGIYHDDVMFGLVADDVLYLKADTESAPRFLAKNLEPFEYVKNGKTMKMSYYRAPEEMYDDPDEARHWAALAFAAAARSRKPKKKAK